MPFDEESHWFDEAAGPLVRPYAMTRGRTRPGNTELDLATQIVSVLTDNDLQTLTPEQFSIIDLCRQPLSVAEVAAYIDVPLIVVKVLVSDLIERGDVVTRYAGGLERPSRNLLEAVLDGVRRI
ncbi:hypothetical protein JOF53_006898 [Crossiella equi]|uniref:DUF742 domain-containing protein n=1 Tax=Crossiella equi TaxID=130796 RepID=A0ABS5ANN5_9PSEU|nr:DUF742 domain-containing protein [Crossiella equi]MBP2478026.1 hypothetical protein [Crossiella equi]